MENDLDIFRKREERKKKKKVKPEPQAVFIAKGKNNEAEVFLTDGEKAECLSTWHPDLDSFAKLSRYE